MIASWWRPTSWAQLLILLGIVCAVKPAFALEHQDFTLDNGLRVILVREAKAPIMISKICYRVGSIDEQPGKTGLSHMLEHMMFQGTPAIPAGEFHRRIAQQGGEDNASTSHDATCYYIKLAADRAALAVQLEADRLRHLSLHEAAFHSENQVVQEERRTRTDGDPNARFLEQFHSKAYAGHPYGRPIIGWMPEIQQLTIQDLRAWWQRYYVPNNAVLVMVGDLDLSAMAEQIRLAFADIPKQAEPPPPILPPLPEQVAADNRRVQVQDSSVTLPLWYGGYPVPTWSDDNAQEVLALELLATILGGGSSSRLYQRLVLQEALAVSTSAHYAGYARSWELFTLAATPNAESNKPEISSPGAALPHMERIILEEVARLAQEPVSERELQRAKNSMIAQHIYSHDSIHELASTIGMLSSSGIAWRTLIEEYPQRLSAVQASDLQRVAARYLRADRLTIGVLQP
ncbi:M16 family metallopeptidase [Candidatus Magnetaquicoccus inordinatus]|uniref:M16 family metallopeptidase n=1 Tax=Candidatus Magnetaquicoccus inordinatus TaxID=2496818 RepID=UPI00102CACEF|nr:pitrilysin family protein [Candidatus Magnetaquicoccus inordinatus]